VIPATKDLLRFRKQNPQPQKVPEAPPIMGATDPRRCWADIGERAQCRRMNVMEIGLCGQCHTVLMSGVTRPWLRQEGAR
jgi:hypothetical protein